MKAKRRQELKTNDLAAALEEFIQGARSWGVYVVGAIAVIVLIVVVGSYMRNARAQEISGDYAELRSVSLTTPNGERRTNAEILADLGKMRDLAAGSSDRRFQLDAQVQRGNLALRAAETGPDGIDDTFLPEAKSAFESVRDVARGNDVIRYGRSLFGLFQVEADAFVIDADLTHRDRAKELLETVRDDARFNGTPYQTMAIRQLNELDDTFQAITFPPQPARETPTTGAVSPTINLGQNSPISLTDLKNSPAVTPATDLDVQAVLDAAAAEDSNPEGSESDAEVEIDVEAEAALPGDD